MKLNGRVIGLDLGRKRVGVALSDQTATIANPLVTLRITGANDLLAQVLELIRTHEVRAVVVGLPARLDGSDTDFSAKARALKDLLADNLAVPVYCYDERFTSKMAQAAIHAAGKNLKRSKDDLDKVAAAIMLNDFLKHNAND